MEAASQALSVLEVAGYAPDQARWYCDHLEQGKVLFFRHVPFEFLEEDRNFLLSQKQTGSRFHKNISYRPATDVLEGIDRVSPDRDAPHRGRRSFSSETTRVVSKFLAPCRGKT